MKGLRILAPVVMLPVWTMFGGPSTFDSGYPLWRGLTVGGAIGVFFGLVFGPEDPNFRDD